MKDAEDIVPDFKSTIPDQLLKSLDPEEVYLFEGISRLEQKTDWLIREVIGAKRLATNTAEVLTDLKERVRKLEDNQKTIMADRDRIKQVEDWKQIFTGKWAVLSALGLLLLSGVVGALCKSAVDRIFSSGRPAVSAPSTPTTPPAKP